MNHGAPGTTQWSVARNNLLMGHERAPASSTARNTAEVDRVNRVLELAGLKMGDSATLWGSLGFILDNGVTHVSGVRHEFDEAGRGILDWGFRSLGEDAQEIAALDDLGFGLAPREKRPTPRHANGVISIDHLVILTPDLSRSIASFERAGITCRRVRDTKRGMHQAFFRLGEVILEVVGAMDGASTGPSSLWGIAYTVKNLDDTAAFLGDRMRPAKPAVQKGRMIATLDRAVGSSVSIAFMSPE